MPGGPGAVCVECVGKSSYRMHYLVDICMFVMPGKFPRLSIYRAYELYIPKGEFSEYVIFYP